MDAAKRIIIVDDDLSIQDAVQMMLEHKGYAVTVHNDGEQLLNGDFDLPQLFIIDKQLPGVDGLALCRMLKERAATSHIPVLILSASPQASALATAAGADGFLEKPFRMQDLRQAVAVLIA